MEKYPKKLSFVIPCYKSEHTITAVVEDICKEFPREKYDKEIVLVNDGSADGTFSTIKKLASENDEIIAVNLSRNFGQDGATMCGYNVASGDYIITLDDDGQNPPCETHKLLATIEEGYDVVFGRYHKKKDSAFKTWGSNFNNKMATVMIGKPKDIMLCSYFIMNSFVKNEIIKYQGAYPYLWGLILRSTRNMANVYIEHKSREVGESTYTLAKLVGLWVDGFTSFSIKPLRITTVLGGFAALVGFVYAIVIIIRTALYGDVSGWTSLMAGILILGGLQMIMIGLLGEYVGRIFINENKAPQFIIREKFSKKTDDAGALDESLK